MKKILFYFFVFLVALNCWAEEKPEVRIGVTVPLTGDYATYGGLIRDGVELAVSELREEGYRVKTFYEDVPTPGLPAVTAIRKLITEDKIRGLAGNFWNPAIPAMAPLLTRNKILSFHTAAVDDYILNAGDFIVSTNTTVAEEGKKLAEFAYRDLNARTATIIKIGTNWGENFAEHFSVNFKKLGGKIIYEETAILGENDYRAILMKLKSQTPDVFFAANFGTNLGLVVKQARQIGYKGQIIAPYEAEDSSVLDVAGKDAEGILYFLSEPTEETDSVKKFSLNYKKKYSEEPSLFARNSYDATMILVKVLSDCNLDSACAKDRVYQIKSYHGASGDFSITADGAATKNFVLKTIIDGKFVKKD